PGVARNVRHERLRDSKRERTTRESVRQDPTLLPIARTHSEEVLYRCLERCMSSLTHRARALLLDYYAEERAAKIESHRNLADQFGKSVNALRIEVHRIRKILRPR